MTAVNRDVVSDIRLAHAAGWLLRLLDEGTGNDRCLSDMLAALGLGMSDAAFRSLTDRIEQAGYVRVEAVEAVPAVRQRRITLDRPGQELLSLRTKCDWITLPD